ncbi:CHAP domain-containing protein [Nonomuraea sp. NPDC046570]|uniref:CHAP domain-containing protein n=1 Tax=Nonomuraea sp. NPDC046570 TaxID=3155255 RepID=UPI0033C782EA
MRPQLGYREKGGQHTKFGEWYALHAQDPQYRNAPWCDMFIAWAAERAGVEEYVGQFAWTPSHAAWFIKHRAWSDTPEPGALVFYDWSGGKSYKGVDHVGIVEKVEGAKIRTIEANVDKVWLKRKFRETDKVVGYGLPRLVKKNAPLLEVRPSDGPAISLQADRPAITAVESRSAFDLLGTPQALLATMVLVTVVISIRLAGRPRPTPASPSPASPPPRPLAHSAASSLPDIRLPDSRLRAGTIQDSRTAPKVGARVQGRSPREAALGVAWEVDEEFWESEKVGAGRGLRGRLPFARRASQEAEVASRGGRDTPPGSRLASPQERVLLGQERGVGAPHVSPTRLRPYESQRRSSRGLEGGKY